MSNTEAIIIIVIMVLCVYGLIYFIKSTKDDNNRDKFA